MRDPSEGVTTKPSECRPTHKTCSIGSSLSLNSKSKSSDPCLLTSSQHIPNKSKGPLRH